MDQVDVSEQFKKIKKRNNFFFGAILILFLLWVGSSIHLISIYEKISFWDAVSSKYVNTTLRSVANALEASHPSRVLFNRIIFWSFILFIVPGILFFIKNWKCPNCKNTLPHQRQHSLLFIFRNLKRWNELVAVPRECPSCKAILIKK